MESKDVFLSANERYDVWDVKKEERPHLLVVEKELPRQGDDDESSHHPLPLIDGCDLEGWRHSELVEVSTFIQGFLNVGSGSTLMRRETQLPILSSKANSKWQQLQQRLLQPPTTTAERICEKDASDLSTYPWFERENVPVIIEGLTSSWKAMESCTWKRLVESFGDYEWRFSDTHGACMMLSTYTKYVQTLEGQSDDAPLAVYDSQLDGDERASLLNDYTVPRCFAAPDLFEGLGNEERPPYRWILMGPARSGTGLHVDPLGTHAWVTVVEGLKRWVLFPYGTDASSIGMQSPQIPSVLWFSNWYEKALARVPHAIEVLQRPGETVYVPAGWPHLVLNLEHTVAITQNYATEYPCFSRIEEGVQREEPELFNKWRECLKTNRPDLACDSTTVSRGEKCRQSLVYLPQANETRSALPPSLST